jgi:hypothetical protein
MKTATGLADLEEKAIAACTDLNIIAEFYDLT